MEKVLGLFGSCNGFDWRNTVVIPLLESSNVAYFNPVVEDWNETARDNEAYHASNDKVISMYISGESTSLASLAESGWIALLSHLNGQKLLFVMHDMENVDSDSKQANKIRHLVRSHLSKLQNQKAVILCDSIVEATLLAIDFVNRGC